VEHRGPSRSRRRRIRSVRDTARHQPRRRLSSLFTRSGASPRRSLPLLGHGRVALTRRLVRAMGSELCLETRPTWAHSSGSTGAARDRARTWEVSGASVWRAAGPCKRAVRYLAVPARFSCPIRTDHRMIPPPWCVRRRQLQVEPELCAQGGARLEAQLGAHSRTRRRVSASPRRSPREVRPAVAMRRKRVKQARQRFGVMPGRCPRTENGSASPTSRWPRCPPTPVREFSAFVVRFQEHAPQRRACPAQSVWGA